MNFNKVIEINPRYAAAYFHLGLAKGRLGDYEGAIADLTRAIEINPQDVVAYINLGIIKGKTSRLCRSLWLFIREP